MEAIDRDTFAEKPERAAEAKETMLALGNAFRNAAVYIVKRLDGIEEGRRIAEALVLEFYEYGQSLIDGKRPDTVPDLKQIAPHDLIGEETQAVDRFLGGDRLYESRRQRAEIQAAKDQKKSEELLEEERERTVSQFFRVIQKALTLEAASAGGKPSKGTTELTSWQIDAPIHRTFLERIESDPYPV